MFDIQKTQKLIDLFSIPVEKRDGAWQSAFYTTVAQASLRALTPQVIQGPDGFSYFALAFPKAHESFESFCIDHILDFCLEHGFGVVILNPPEPEPLWIFRYGDLSSYKQYKSFDGDPADAQPHDVTSPTIDIESLLPRAARTVIKAFLKKNVEAMDPGVALYVNATLHPSRNLVFNLYREQFSKSEDYDRVMHQLLWFLPRTRGLVGANPSFIRAVQFQNL